MSRSTGTWSTTRHQSRLKYSPAAGRIFQLPLSSRSRSTGRSDNSLAGYSEDIMMTIEAVGAVELCNVYGATETYGNCAVTDAHDPLDQRLHSQGLPLPGMTIWAVDRVTREALPADEVGELVVAGYVIPGYYGAPELDAAAFDQ